MFAVQTHDVEISDTADANAARNANEATEASALRGQPPPLSASALNAGDTDTDVWTAEDQARLAREDAAFSAATNGDGAPAPAARAEPTRVPPLRRLDTQNNKRPRLVRARDLRVVERSELTVYRQALAVLLVADVIAALAFILQRADGGLPKDSSAFVDQAPEHSTAYSRIAP
jgi:hypothetical protein